MERLNPALGNDGERTEDGGKIYPSIGWGSKSTKLKELLSDPDGFINNIARVAASRRGKIVDFGRAFYDPNGVPVDTHMSKLTTPDAGDVRSQLVGAKGDKDSRAELKQMIHESPTPHKLAQAIAQSGHMNLQRALLDAQKRVIDSAPVYKAYKVAIAHAAQQLGWEPRQIQETAWSAVVGIIAAKNAGVPHDAILQFLRHENAFQAWNVGGLLSTPEITRDIAGLSTRPTSAFVAEANRAPARAGQIDPGNAAAFADVVGRVPASRNNGAWQPVERSIAENQ